MRKILIIVISILVVGMIVLTVLTMRRDTNSDVVATVNNGGEIASTTNEFFPISPDIGKPPRPQNPGGVTDTTDTGYGTPADTTGEQNTGGLKRVAKGVAGYEVFGSARNLDLVLRYIESETGHVYEHLPMSGTLKRLTNTTITKMQNSYWMGKDELVIIRTNEYGARVAEEMRIQISLESAGQLSGVALSPNTTTVSKTADGATILRFEKITVGGSRLIARPIGTKRDAVLLESALSEWQIIPSGKNIYVQTRSSAFAIGYLFRVSAGSLEKVLGDIRGITTSVSPSERYIIYTENNADRTQTKTTQDYASGIRTNVYDTKTRDVGVFPLETFPEKCVWSRKTVELLYCGAPKNLDLRPYPDSWYRGEVSFSDTLWAVNLARGNATEIVDPVAVVSEEIDMIDLRLSVDEEYVFFRNKKDNGLWQFKINPVI